MIIEAKSDTLQSKCNPPDMLRNVYSNSVLNGYKKSFIRFFHKIDFILKKRRSRIAMFSVKKAQKWLIEQRT